MSIELCVLASGSSGNCSLVRTPGGAMLIDAGIGPRATAGRLAGTGVSVANISAICLTHLDRDHFSSNWVATAIQLNLAIYCHVNCVAKLLAIMDSERAARLVRSFHVDTFEPLPGLSAQPVAAAHDREGSHAFVFEGYGHRLGYATDLGHVPAALYERFVDLDMLAIESNYDPQMQAASTRPYFLKQRITGGRGHLSNEQALEAVRRILDRAERQAASLPAHIVLLHRSLQCNCPKLVKRLFSADSRIAQRLVLSEQFSRTEWLSAADRRVIVGEQMVLAWG